VLCPDDLIDFLHQFFPRRALALAASIEELRPEDHPFQRSPERLMIKFIRMLDLNTSDLERAHHEKRISTLAWAARNILELSVWIEYCTLTDENARRFQEDAVRDLAGFSDAVQTAVHLTEGQQHAELGSVRLRLTEFAASTLGIPVLGNDFQRVAQAATVIGRGESFSAANKMFSKFAHPTAWAVHTVESIDADEGLRNMFLSDGIEMATDALTRIRQFVLPRLRLESSETLV
jgi:hypothetical protein